MQHRALLPAEVVLHDLPPRDATLPDRLGGGQFLVADSGPPRFDEIVRRLDGLEVVQTLSAGVDRFAGHIPAGVTLCDGSGIHDVAVAEWIVMVVLASRRGLSEHLAAQREGVWRPGSHGGGDDLEGASVLIVGHGAIGRALEARLRPFGVRMLRVALHPRRGVSGVNELRSLLPMADVVVILVPLTEGTRRMVDAGFLAAMRPGALLVNASRGEVVDSEALDSALRAEHVRAALDVTDPEPLPAGDRLWSAPGLLLTPHIAGHVHRRLDRSWAFVAGQLRRFVAGEPLVNVVVEGY